MIVQDRIENLREKNKKGKKEKNHWLRIRFILGAFMVLLVHFLWLYIPPLFGRGLRNIPNNTGMIILGIIGLIGIGLLIIPKTKSIIGQSYKFYAYSLIIVMSIDSYSRCLYHGYGGIRNKFLFIALIYLLPVYIGVIYYVNKKRKLKNSGDIGSNEFSEDNLNE